MTNDTEDRPMTADIIAFGAPRAPTPAPSPAAEAPSATSKAGFGALAKVAAVGVAQGAAKAVGFSAYVLLFATRGLVRFALGLVGGISLLGLIFAFFMPQSYEHRGTALTIFGILFVGSAVLRIAFERALYALTPEGSPLA